MMSSEKLAYFFDASDLAGVFRDWPEEIGLVLCMDAEGGCEMLLHHVDEGREVIGRISAVLDRPVGDFAVVPPVEGLPTCRVMFSDEQKLLKMVAAETELPEMAADHLINYRFEQDRRERRAEVARAMPKVAKPAAPEGQGGWRPRFRLTDVRPKERAAPGLPGGYVTAGEARKQECVFVEGRLSQGARGVRLVIAPERVTVRTAAIRAKDLAFRDDFSRFVIPREAIGDWYPGEPLVVDMGEELFPAALAQRLGEAARLAEVTVTGHGVFVAPGARIAAPEPVAETPEVVAPKVPLARRPRRRLLTPIRLALVALTGVGLMTGSVIRAVDSSDPPAILRSDR